MEITFEVKAQLPKDIKFSFGNIKSDYSANCKYFTKCGAPYFPISGEFHFSRYESSQWKRELLKMKANGLNVVATYIFWIHHEEIKGEYRFDGNRDISKFLAICKELDLPCVLRIGPWAHGECVYGGFPKYVQKMTAKRSDSREYLDAVKAFWSELFRQVKSYCDGNSILGIQLENEYNGNISHIHTLRKLAEDIGFKTPFFTMTAWPTNTPDYSVLPMFGGYPEAPWTWHKKPLIPKGRFAICHGRNEVEIGEDLIKGKRESASFDDFPYAGCEVGVGNQVTQHRRPIIDDKDGYGVAFAKFASGMNWLGYYMYHGGRNPYGGLYQESRRTLYPNNYPIVDYDFQAPISKDGELRSWAHKLRLLHIFIENWDSNLPQKNAYFSSFRVGGDQLFPYCSIRCDENLSGYLFVSNYERGLNSENYSDVKFKVCNGSKEIILPSLNIPKNAMFFFPFGFNVGDVFIDYLTAQPIAKVGNTHYYCACDNIKPIICIDGKESELKSGTIIDGIKIEILDKSKALQFYLTSKGVVYFDGALFEEKGNIYCERTDKISSARFECVETFSIELPYNHYLYSYGKRKFYELKIDKNALEKYENIILKFEFCGLNMQAFLDGKIIDDCFNCNGEYRLHLRQFKNQLLSGEKIIFKLAPYNNFGVGKVYCESAMVKQKPSLKLLSVLSETTVEL